MTRTMMLASGTATALLVVTGVALAQELTVEMKKITDSGPGEKIGTVVVSDAKNGVSFKVNIKDVPKGQRGFHVHEKGDCGPATKDGKMTAGMAAGPHYDPDAKKSHKGPHGAGHQGDLPVLEATEKGVSQTVTAPRLELADIRGRALMIHEGGDNYSDSPENGGGAGRIACGVIPKN